MHVGSESALSYCNCFIMYCCVCTCAIINTAVVLFIADIYTTIIFYNCSISNIFI